MEKKPWDILSNNVDAYLNLQDAKRQALSNYNKSPAFDMSQVGPEQGFFAKRPNVDLAMKMAEEIKKQQEIEAMATAMKYYGIIYGE